MPGWIRPGKRTPGMWRLVHQMPSNSQMAFVAVGKWSVRKPPATSQAVHDHLSKRGMPASNHRPGQQGGMPALCSLHHVTHACRCMGCICCGMHCTLPMSAGVNTGAGGAHTAVVAVEGAGEAPLVAEQRAQVADLHYEDVARVRWLALGIRHLNGPAQEVRLGAGGGHQGRSAQLCSVPPRVQLPASGAKEFQRQGNGQDTCCCTRCRPGRGPRA